MSDIYSIFFISKAITEQDILPWLVSNSGKQEPFFILNKKTKKLHKASSLFFVNGSKNAYAVELGPLDTPTNNLLILDIKTYKQDWLLAEESV